jgi:hypothetical protein
VRGVALSLFSLLWLGCSPDYGHSAFRCDASHRCPDDQTCSAGRCRRGPPTGDGVACGSAACDLTQQCCYYDGEPPRCIPAGDVCPDTAALCDGAEDCQTSDRCCSDGSTHACDATCRTYVCREDDDCPSTTPHCCNENSEPWRECSKDPCL